jgi:hypothetical protein
MANETRADKTISLLLWLIPATYVLHIAEEYWGGEGFPAYIARTRGVHLSPSRFLLMNSIGCALMVLGVVLAHRYKFRQWLLVCLGMVVMGNGLSHTVNSIVTREYNPGVVSGLLIWIPLGLMSLVYAKRGLAGRKFWVALAIGIGILLVVALLALSGGNPLSLFSKR